MTPNCPQCGTVMCEKFDERPGPNPLVIMAVPNGKFSCMKCGYDPESPTIVEVGGKWFWIDETENFGNVEPCATRAEAEKQQKEYGESL